MPRQRGLEVSIPRLREEQDEAVNNLRDTLNETIKEELESAVTEVVEHIKGENDDDFTTLFTAVDQIEQKLGEAISDTTEVTIKKYSGSSVAALTLTTTMATDFPGRKYRLKGIEVTWSSAPTTSQNLTLTRVASSEISPDTVLYSRDPSVASLTSLNQNWEDEGKDMEAGDELTLAYTNTDTRTVKADIILEVL